LGVYVGCTGGVAAARSGLLLTVCLVLLYGYDPSSATSPRTYEDGPNYIARLNFGVAATKMQPVFIADGTWTHTFHLQLPNLTAAQPLQPVCRVNDTECLRACDATCRQLTGLYAAVTSLTVTMRMSITHFVRRVYQVIPDVHMRFPEFRPATRRRLRSPFDFVGSAASYLFGVGTTSDIEALKADLQRVQQGAEVMAADAVRTREGLATFTKLQNERLDKIHAVLREEQASITRLYTNVRAAHDTAALEMNALTIVMNELARFVALHDDVQELALGIDETLHAQLSPKLITVAQLREMINDVNDELVKQGARLCLNSPREVYMLKSFDIARAQNDLIIRLRLPYTWHPRMSVYKTFTFPSAVPGQQQFVSKISDFPQYIIADAHKALIGELSEPPKASVVEYAEIKWHKPGSGSCLYELLEDNANATKRACDFTLRQEVIAPSLTKLSDKTYVVSNYSDLVITCLGATHSNVPVTTCDLCLLRLECNCVLRSNGMILVKEKDCNSTSETTSSLLHSVHVPLLQTFYEVANNTLSGRLLILPHELQKQEDITLPIFGQNMSRLLAADKAVGYSLNKLAESLQNKSVVYHTPADAIVHEVMQQMSRPRSFWSFDITSWMSWMSYLMYALTIILCVLWYSTHRRLAVLTTALSVTASRVSAYELRNEFKPVTSTLPPSVNMTAIISTVIAQMRSFDTVHMVMNLFIIAIFLTVLAHVIRQALGRRSYVYLQILSSRQCTQIRYATLPDATRRHVVRVSSTALTIKLSNFYVFGILHVMPKPPKIVNTLTSEVKRLHSYTVLPPWTTWQLQRHLATENCTVSPMLVHTHEYVFLSEYKPPEYTAQHM
jgi:hypothetical protein